MFFKRINLILLFLPAVMLSSFNNASAGFLKDGKNQKVITISTPKMTMVVNYDHKVCIESLIVNGQKVISSADGIYTALTVKGFTYSSLKLKIEPAVNTTNNVVKISGIIYGDQNLTISENWVFTKTGKSINWSIERKLSKAVNADESGSPVFNFDSIDTWEGAYQGYGGLAWFYLFNEKLCTYGVHTKSSDFWNSKTGNGLNITVNAPGKNVAMKYSRTAVDKLNYVITSSDKAMVPKSDTGTNRRLFLRGHTDVWAPFNLAAAATIQHLTFTYFDYNEKYGRGKFAGINGKQVSGVLGTIARIGVIDSLHYGGNSWATPYGPICLHEQYIAQLGLGINDPHYLQGYKSCLDFYRDHAIKPDGRVFPRWAYTNEDAMPGQYNSYGFYEAQWGILLDSNPDFVTNVAELYELTGDKPWVKTHQTSCEKVLDWLLKRDSNNNGLVEMMSNLESEKKSSDWIDIIWASYENAFVNANLYHALIKWADIERQLNNYAEAKRYNDFASKLKTSFNKPTTEGGFWDEEHKCYVHWRDKDNTIHGRNMVTPVNFMAIAYGICDDPARKKEILDNIEAQMQQEKLFFWPLAMKSYARGEGKKSQFPFPEYENGDLFLSWGALGVNAYADYKPEIAVKYVKNILEQYSKDGLAYQRYGRLKQNGLGDDILSGNSLSIVGLYQAVYGINPLYNRFYLNPHITPELAGTELKYKFRGEQLSIKLNTVNYTVSNGRFAITDSHDFGFYSIKDQLSYFNGNSSTASMKITTTSPLKIKIQAWDKRQMQWEQTITQFSAKSVNYLIDELNPNTGYSILVDGKTTWKVMTNAKGELSLSRTVLHAVEKIVIKDGN
jgi:hypothetical protein